MNRDKLIELLHAVQTQCPFYTVVIDSGRHSLYEIAVAAIKELNKPQIVNIDHIDVFNG